jgi:hypothetical protein
VGEGQGEGPCRSTNAGPAKRHSPSSGRFAADLSREGRGVFLVLAVAERWFKAPGCFAISPERIPSLSEQKPSPFADLISAVAWLTLAVGIIVLSWRMDRLAHLQVSIYTAPGLVPGMLGIALALMAAILFARAAGGGAFAGVSWPRLTLAGHWRLLVAFALSMVFAVVMVGSGMPFWLAAAIYVAAMVLIFGLAEADSERPIWRSAAFAIAYGSISGAVIHYVFQDLFLVRLP